MMDHEMSQYSFPKFRVGPRGRPGSGWRALIGVLRGGSWINNNPANLRAANRNNDHPGNRNHNYGFRVVVCVGECRKADRMKGRRDAGWGRPCPAGAKKPSLNPPSTPHARGEKTRRQAVAGNGCLRGSARESHGLPCPARRSASLSQPPVMRPISSRRPLAKRSCCWLIHRRS